MCQALPLVIVVVQAGLPAASMAEVQAGSGGGRYTIVVEGYDWGAGVSKAILSMDKTVTSANARDYTVAVRRHTDCGPLAPEQSAGERVVVHAYVSDEKGAQRQEGSHVTLVLAVAPGWPLGSPIQYVRNDRCRGNVWVDYDLTVTEKAGGRVWDTRAGRVMPLVDRFDLSGRFAHASGKTLSYASFTPRTNRQRSPLLIWLHGGGEGGSDPTIPLLGNRATAYASDTIQAVFEGAYVLVPQCPGAWMHNAAGVMTHGQEDDVYNVALMALIRDYVAAHPGIDRNRIYLGGCSNGGYMTLKLMLLQPDYFAAGFISSLAYPGTSPTSRSSASRRFRSGSCIPRMTRPRCPSRRCFPSTSGSGPQAPATSTSRSTTTSSTSRASSAERITATTGTGPGSTSTRTSAGSTVTEAP